MASNNANGGTTQQQQQHRRSRSWLDGTMDIISDARNRPRTARSPSPAPRPRRAALQTPPASPGGGIFSGLRSASPTPGQQMIIGRMPSQDAMDMSVHNDLDSSAHGGRSVGGNDLHDNMGGSDNLDSSIHGLRSANSTLTTKMADMEADYLNQITGLHAQIKTLQDKCRLKDAQLETLESDAATAEKDLELLEMSKHTIADLKAQLYSLQDQVEDAEYAKQEEIDQLTKDGAEKERLLREQILTLEAEVEEWKENAGGAGAGAGAGGGGGGDGDAATNNASSGSINANGSVGRHVADADIKAYEDEIAMLKEQLTEAKPVWGQIDALRKEKDREISELRSMLRARDDTIASLQGKNTAMADDLTALEAEVDRLQSEGDAATDREEELTVLRSTLAEREDQLSSTKTELEEQVDLAAQLTKEIADLKESHKSLRAAGTDRDAEMNGRVATLEEQLKLANEAVASLTKEVEEYQRRVTALEEERDDATTNLEAARKELAAAQEESNAREAASQDVALLRKEVEDVTRERVALEGELTKKLATAKKENLQAITKMEIQLKEKEEEIDTLKARLEDSTKAESDELAAVRTQLQEAQQALVALDNEMKESQKAAGDKADGELRQLREQLEERTQEYETVKESLSSLESSLKDRDAELETARNQITSLEASVEELENGVIKPVQRGISDAPDGEGGTTGSAASRIRSLEAIERELKTKLEDRDMTISTLVKSSTRAESNMNQLKAEVASLQEQVKQAGGTVSAARGAGSDDSSTVKELQDKLATLIEAKEKMATQHRDQILERDAAISKLVKSSVSLEQHITSLQAEVERLRKKKTGGKKADGPAWEELHRLQQESEIFAGQIIEQDEEIEGLRGELDEQRAINATLSKQVAELKSNGHVANAANQSKLTDLQAHLDEVQKVNKAQREELRDLQYKLRDAQAEADRVADLEVQLREAQSSPSKSRSMSSFDIDEIEEFEMREELEHLRRSKTALEKELRQMKANGSVSAAAVAPRSSKVEEELRQDLEDAIATKEASEQRLTKQIESLRKLKDSAKHEFEETLRERNEEITSLKESVAQQELVISSLQKEIDGFESVIDKEQDQVASSLRGEISSLKSILDEKSAKVKKLEEETDDLRNRLEEQTILATKERRNAEVEFGEDVKVANMDKDALIRKVYELEGELKSLESDYSNIRDLRKRLKNAEEDRSIVEQKVAVAFEKKITLLQTEKDAEIDRLRKDLTVSKEKLIELENERAALLRKLDDSNVEIQEELEERLQQKNIRIMALEQTLSAQEQVLGNMQAEMDQLQSGMDKVSLTRRAEIEEMEQELMESAQAVTKYEREIVVLKDKLEDVHLRHSGEVDRLKQRIKQLESETPYERSVREQRDDHKVQELNEKIDQLKWRLTDLQDDNQRLREKLEESNTAHKRGLSSTERYRTAALQEQVHKLSQKNKDLEKELTVTASSTSYANGILNNNDDVEEEVEISLSADGDSLDIDHNTSPAKSSARDDLPPPPPPSSKSYGKSARDRSTPSKFGGVGASFHRRKTSSGANGSSSTPGSSLKKHFGRSRSRSKPRPDDPSTKTEETF